MSLLPVFSAETKPQGHFIMFSHTLIHHMKRTLSCFFYQEGHWRGRLLTCVFERGCPQGHHCPWKVFDVVFVMNSILCVWWHALWVYFKSQLIKCCLSGQCGERILFITSIYLLYMTLFHVHARTIHSLMNVVIRSVDITGSDFVDTYCRLGCVCKELPVVTYSVL